MTSEMRCHKDEVIMCSDESGSQFSSGLYSMQYEEIQEKFIRIASYLDEKSKRLWCANEALSLGWRGVTLVSQATGMSRATITKGIKELTSALDIPHERIRRPGGGRKKKQLKTRLFNQIWKS